jgi:hypothetical protein
MSIERLSILLHPSHLIYKSEFYQLWIKSAKLVKIFHVYEKGIFFYSCLRNTNRDVYQRYVCKQKNRCST